ncbi:MAG TPA: hypothetical protein VHT53_05320 [Candidatus Elarobacter sp.]|nr:hypothetical protein [Candidatus Elarobacter sp.]
MDSPTTPYTSDISPKRAGIATLLLVAMFSIFAFAPPRDHSKLVRGIPCSVLSEDDISAALGTQVRLMPTSGTVCRYVSTTNGSSKSLIVIARSGNPHAVVFHVIPQAANDPTVAIEESRLTHMVHRQVAANR